MTSKKAYDGRSRRHRQAAGAACGQSDLPGDLLRRILCSPGSSCSGASTGSPPILKGASTSPEESVCKAARGRRDATAAVCPASVAGRKDRMWPSVAPPSLLSLPPLQAMTVLDPESMAAKDLAANWRPGL